MYTEPNNSPIATEAAWRIWDYLRTNDISHLFDEETTILNVLRHGLKADAKIIGYQITVDIYGTATTIEYDGMDGKVTVYHDLCTVTLERDDYRDDDVFDAILESLKEEDDPLSRDPYAKYH